MGCVQSNQQMWSTSSSAYGAHLQTSIPGTSHMRSNLRGSSPQNLPKQPKGLENLGNTCYISAVLQILFQIFDEKEIQIKSKSQQTISYLFFELRKTRDTRDYKSFKKALEERVQIVQGWDQQDAHQLLIHLLEEIGNENPLPLKKGCGKVDLNYNEKANYQKNWEKFVSENQKWEHHKVTSLFYGEILKRFTCYYQHQKHNFQRYMDLSLPFTPKSSNSQYSHSYSIQGPLKVTDMLSEFLGQEPIEDLYCQRCKKKMKFTKESVLYSIPKYFILHLSRFVKGWYSNQKNKRQVEFDQILDLKQRNGQVKVKLRLVGIVHHQGTLNRGHYYADIKVGPEWYEMNDQKVYKSDVKERKNISKSAYLLIYQRVS